MIEYKNFKNECGIYCFINKVNGKCYVGQGINLKKRLRSHYAAMKRQDIKNMIFYAAVAKYGIENFDLEILEFLDPTLEQVKLKELLDEKEKYYIQEKNSYVPNGYNQTLGGDAGVLGYKMTEEQKEKIREASKENQEKFKKRIWIRKISEPRYSFGYTYEEAAEKTNVSRSVIQSICNKRHTHPYSKGWTFAFDEITLFNNCAQALRDMSSGIYMTNSGKFKSKNLSQELLSKVRRSVVELDSNGTIIKEFDSVKSLMDDIGCKSTSLSNYLHSNRKYFRNRIFAFKNPPIKRQYSEETLERLRNGKRITKLVLQYDLNDVLIATHNSIMDAANSINTDRKSISRCCHGKAKTCKGYVWKFTN